jgi:hypothetical protein
MTGNSDNSINCHLIILIVILCVQIHAGLKLSWNAVQALFGKQNTIIKPQSLLREH